MKWEEQVVSLELAKRMKELGFNGKSIFYWSHKWEGSSDEDAGKDILTFGYDEYNTLPICKAYNVAELGLFLPHGTRFCKGEKGWTINEPTEKDKQTFGFRAGKTEANARAKMLIYLAENKLIDPANL